jgi:lipoyl(octanoyl) transferase
MLNSQSPELPSILNEIHPKHLQQVHGIHVLEYDLLSFSDYLQVLDQLTTFTQEQPEYAFLISCSHPLLLTMGRGLQKKTEKELTPFQPENRIQTHPLFHINRGGGVTLHHPGQFIFYPILNLNFFRISMNKVLLALLHEMSKTINEIFELDTEVRLDPLGLWIGDNKLASAGIGLNRWVTQHGIALNLEFNSNALKALSSIAPCGLQSTEYKDLKSFSDHDQFSHNLIQLKKNYIDSLTSYFAKRSKNFT